MIVFWAWLNKSVFAFSLFHLFHIAILQIHSSYIHVCYNCYNLSKYLPLQLQFIYKWLEKSLILSIRPQTLDCISHKFEALRDTTIPSPRRVCISGSTRNEILDLKIVSRIVQLVAVELLHCRAVLLQCSRSNSFFS